MSEPFDLHLHCKIAPTDLYRYLTTPIPPASDYADWSQLSYEFGPRDFETAIRVQGRPAVRYLTQLRDMTRAQYGWRFQYSHDTQQLTIAALMWSNNWLEILAGLTALRPIAAYTNAQGGLIIQDITFGQGNTIIAIEFNARQSNAVHPESPAAMSLAADATPRITQMLETARAQYENPVTSSPDIVLIDQFTDFTQG